MRTTVSTGKEAARHNAGTRSNHWGSGGCPGEERQGELFGLRATTSEHSCPEEEEEEEECGRLD